MTTRKPGGVDRVLLCDADDCLFPSERPAYEASAVVTNEFLRSAGVDRRYTGQQLRREYTGLNFRAALPILARQLGVGLTAEEVEHWVAVEKDVVTRHLALSLRPTSAVLDPLREVSAHTRLAVVSSSASRRIGACLQATSLDPLFPGHARFSAEDSLPRPASKPDPAVYELAVRSLGIASAEDVLAVEDSEVGVRAAHGAGVPVVGLVQFVAGPEREARTGALLRAGASTVLDSWKAVARLVDPSREHAPADGKQGAHATRTAGYLPAGHH